MSLTAKTRAAVIGGSESGKTFLSIGWSRGLWAAHRLRSIVFDPYAQENNWGPQAWVTADFEKFERAAFGTKGCAVFWDEGTMTGGRDRANLKFFTAIRHNHPVFVFIGHGFATMLPIMRGSLTDLILARRDPRDADQWAALTSDAEVMQATELAQYEFLQKRMFKPVRRLRYSAEQIKAGVVL